MVRALVVLVLTVILPLTVSAQESSFAFGTPPEDDNEPVRVTSENLAVDQESGTAIFTDNVIVIQGTMRMAAPWVKAVYDKEEKRILWIHAMEGVTLVDGEDAAEAVRADYDLDAGLIYMYEDVLATQGFSAVASDEMIVNRNDGTAVSTGNVKTILD